MSQSNINEKLFNLYQRHFDQFISKLSHEEDHAYSYPLLLKIKEDKWLAADTKIMIFGQETVGWGNHDHDNSIESLMNKYYAFYYKEPHVANQTVANKARVKSTFFKGFGRVTKFIKRYPDYKNNKIEIIWNNINKVGRYVGAGVLDSTRQVERENFRVISDEIAILNPDLIVFFTGPDRDDDIKFNFPDATVLYKCTKALGSKGVIGKYALIEGYPFNAIRLNHPASFRNCTNEYLKYAINDWLMNKQNKG